MVKNFVGLRKFRGVEKFSGGGGVEKFWGCGDGLKNFRGWVEKFSGGGG